MPTKPKQKPSPLHSVYSKFLHLDMFAQAPSFEVEGERYYRTSIGSIMSCLIMIIVAPFVAKRYSIMVDYKDTRYSTSNRQNKFINEHSNMETGITFEEAEFKMAYTLIPELRDISKLVDENGNIDMVREPWQNYLDVGLKYRWYHFTSPYVIDISSEDISMHPCGTFAEEGFYETDPNDETRQKITNDYGMMCIDDNDKYKLFGMFNSDNQASIQLEITACDPSARADPSSCETDEAKILAYMERNVVRIKLLTNFKEYDTHNY